MKPTQQKQKSECARHLRSARQLLNNILDSENENFLELQGEQLETKGGQIALNLSFLQEARNELKQILKTLSYIC